MLSVNTTHNNLYPYTELITTIDKKPSPLEHYRVLSRWVNDSVSSTPIQVVRVEEGRKDRARGEVNCLKAWVKQHTSFMMNLSFPRVLLFTPGRCLPQCLREHSNQGHRYAGPTWHTVSKGQSPDEPNNHITCCMLNGERWLIFYWNITKVKTLLAK